MLLLILLGGLGVEADDRQQVLGVGEHLLLDHHAQLLVGQPRGVAAVVLGAGAEHEVDDLVAEILGIADAGRLLDLFQLLVESHPIEDFTGVGVAVLLVLDPEVGVHHVAIEDVLPVFAVGLQVRGLNLLADEVHVAGCQILLDETQIAVAYLVGELLLLDLLFEHVEQVHRVGRHLGIVIVEYTGQDLECKAGREPVHALVDAGIVTVLLYRLGLGVGVLQILAIVDPHLGVHVGVFRLLEP